MVNTKFGANSHDMGNSIFTIARPFVSTPEQGGEWLATSPEAASLKGEYVSVTSKQACDLELARNLWSLSEQLCYQAISKPRDDKTFALSRLSEKPDAADTSVEATLPGESGRTCIIF